MDYAHWLFLPLQRETTATETTHSNGITIPEVLMDSVSAWQAIKDDSIAFQTGKNIQAKINEMFGVTADEIAEFEKPCPEYFKNH